MWIARDRSGFLYLYKNKPTKLGNAWGFATVYTDLPNSMFPDVKWEDDEPTEVEIVIKTKNK